MKSTERRKDQFNLGSEYMMTPPDIMFSEKMMLDCGDITFRMFYMGEAHTNADIIIYIPEEKLLCAGDIFDYNYIPWIDPEGIQDVDKWIAVLSEIFNGENEIETVVGGHREIFSGDLMKRYIRYLNELWTGVKESIAENLSLEETKTRLLKSISREGFGHLWSTDEHYLQNIEGVWKIQKKRK
jgi:glyoxylase-like metal-dependent hydrolase (beta-lactamase superfamily II)